MVEKINIEISNANVKNNFYIKTQNCTTILTYHTRFNNFSEDLTYVL